MKKIITLVCATVMAATMLCGCKIGKCDICGESGILSERTVFGTDLYVCSDCGG